MSWRVGSIAINMAHTQIVCMRMRFLCDLMEILLYTAVYIIDFNVQSDIALIMQERWNFFMLMRLLKSIGCFFQIFVVSNESIEKITRVFDAT